MKYFDYFITQQFNNAFTYSVDKIVIKGSLRYGQIDTVLKNIEKLYFKYIEDTSKKEQMAFSYPSGIYYWGCQSYENGKNLSYKINYNFELFDSYSKTYPTFWLGIGFNRFGKVDYENFKLEFNPNKILPCEFCDELFSLLISSSYFLELKEYDIACDIPLARNFFSLSTRQGRKYSCVVNSALDKTEYSGVRHTNGYTKVYNKSIESNLKEDLTRVEFTFNSTNFEDCVKSLPCVYILDYKQYSISDEPLNDTEQFILNTLIYEPERVSELGRYMQSKMKKFLENYVYSYFLPKKAFSACIDILKSIKIVEVALND